MTLGTTNTFSFPTFKDPDSFDKATMTNIKLGTASTFVTGKFPSYQIKPVSTSLHAGTFPISVTLKDNNTLPLQATYTFNIIVTAP